MRKIITALALLALGGIASAQTEEFDLTTSYGVCANYVEAQAAETMAKVDEDEALDAEIAAVKAAAQAADAAARVQRPSVGSKNYLALYAMYSALQGRKSDTQAAVSRARSAVDDAVRAHDRAVAELAVAKALVYAFGGECQYDGKTFTVKEEDLPAVLRERPVLPSTDG